MCLGALAGATLFALSGDRFEAEAIVAVQPGSSGGPQADYWHEFAEVSKLRQVATAAAEVSPSGVAANDIAARVRVVGRPRSGLIRVRARGASVAQAVALADSVAAQGVHFMRRVARQNFSKVDADVSFAFEGGKQGWVEQTDFSRRTRVLRVLPGRTYAGSGRLFFTCGAGAAGCGPGVKLPLVLHAGVTYRASLLARSAAGSGRLGLVLGVPRDNALGRAVALTSTKPRNLSVVWTPGRTTSRAMLVVRTTGTAALGAFIDDVTVTDQADGQINTPAARRARDLVAAQRVRRAAAIDRFVVAERAASLGERHGGAATRAALAAGGAGVLALASLAFGAAATRRRVQYRRSDQASEAEASGSDAGESPPIAGELLHAAGTAPASRALGSRVGGYVHAVRTAPASRALGSRVGGYVHAVRTAPASRALRPRVAGYSTVVEPYVCWMVLLACVAFFLQSAGTIELVYTIRPSFVVLAMATIIGLPLVWTGWSLVPKWVLWPAVALALVYAISALGGAGSSLGDGRAGPRRELAYLADLGLGLATFGLVVALWSRGRITRTLLGALVLSGALAGAYGSYQWLAQELGWPLSNVLSVMDSNGVTADASQGVGVLGFERARGTFLEPHFLGAFVAGAIPLTVALWPGAHTRWHRWGLVTSAAVMIAALLFTTSVPAWAILLGCSMSILALWCLRHGGRRAAGVAAAAIVTLLLALTLVITSPGVLEPITGRPSAQLELTSAFRTTAWNDVTAIWSRRPLLGYGPGQSSVQLTAELTGSPDAPSLASAQGVWAAALIDGGAMGLACWVLLIGAVVCYGLLGFIRRPSLVHGAVAAAALAAVASALVAGDRLEPRTWVVLGLLFVVTRSPGNDRRPSETPSLPAVVQ